MTINDIIKRIRTDIITKIPATKSLLRNSLLMVLVESLSGIFLSFYKSLDIVKRDSTVLTATGSRLDEFGQIWSTPRKQATKTTLTVKINTLDASIPQDTVFSDLSGNQYISLQNNTVVAGNVLVALESVLEGYIEEPILIGSDNPDYDVSEITLYTPSQDIENDDDYRDRILNRIKYVPSGGNAKDYERWLLECASVSSAYVLPNELQYGQTLLSYKINGNIPDGSFDDTYIKNYIDLKKPLTADVIVGKPIPRPIDITIKLYPDTAEIRTNVLSELTTLAETHFPRQGTVFSSTISDRISRAIGVNTHDLILPTENIKMGPYELPELGAVTFV